MHRYAYNMIKQKEARIMKKTTKALLCIFAIALLGLSAVGCTPNETAQETPDKTVEATPEQTPEATPEKTTDKATLVMGTSADYPPYEFHIMKDGKDMIVGFDIDIAQAIADDMGMELDIKDMNFDGLLMALSEGQVDMVVAGMNPSDERKESADFSIMYYYSNHTAVLPAGKEGDIKELSDLDGLKIGVQKGTLQEQTITEKVKAKEIISLGKVTDLVLALQSGTVEAIFLEKPVAESYCQANSDIAVSGIAYKAGESGTAIAVKKGNTELLDKINATLAKLIEEGKVDEFVAAANILAENSAE